MQSRKIVLRWAEQKVAHFPTLRGRWGKQMTKMQNKKCAWCNQVPGEWKAWEEEAETTKEKKHFIHQDEGETMSSTYAEGFRKEESSTLKVNAKGAVTQVISEATDLWSYHEAEETDRPTDILKVGFSSFLCAYDSNNTLGLWVSLFGICSPKAHHK